MSVNRGKQFEAVIEDSFGLLPKVSVDRLHDQTTGYSGSTNICDYIVYKKPFIYYIECKSVHGNTLAIYGKDPKKAYGDITNKQWEGLKEKAKIEGVLAGIMCWWVDKDVTKFIPIQLLDIHRESGAKSIRFDTDFRPIHEFETGAIIEPIVLKGRKKRVFFEYDMKQFFIDGEHILRGDKYDL